MTALPPISSVPSLPTELRARILDTLFEPCTQLHTLSVATLHENTYRDYASLISAIGTQLHSLLNSSSTSDSAWLNGILSAHPRLGEKKVESKLSQGEQAQLRVREEEAEGLQDLNEEYEKTFPGLRYVTFVNGRCRTFIIEDMRQRIERADLRQEKRDAIAAMCDIAIDRAEKLGEWPEP